MVLLLRDLQLKVGHILDSMEKISIMLHLNAQVWWQRCRCWDSRVPQKTQNSICLSLQSPLSEVNDVFSVWAADWKEIWDLQLQPPSTVHTLGWIWPHPFVDSFCLKGKKFLSYLLLSLPPLPLVLPPSSASSAAWAERAGWRLLPLRLSEGAMRRKQLSPCWHQHIWDILIPFVFFVFFHHWSHICVQTQGEQTKHWGFGGNNQSDASRFVS